MAKEKISDSKNTAEDQSRPNLFLPDRIDGEGFKLPKPPSYDFLSKVDFDADGAAGTPPAGGGSGNNGLDLFPYLQRPSETDRCRICNGRKNVTAFVSQWGESTEILCPLCSGQGTVGALRKPTSSEDDEIVDLLKKSVFDVQTPLVVKTGRFVTVCLKRLFGYSDYSGAIDSNGSVTFLVAAIARSDRAKLVVGSNHEFTVVGDIFLITSENRGDGDLTLTVDGLKTGFESLSLEAKFRIRDEDVPELVKTRGRGRFERLRGVIRKMSGGNWGRGEEKRGPGHMDH